MIWLAFFLFFVFTLLVLYHQLPFRIWELGTAIYLLALLFSPISWSATVLLWALASMIIACFRLPGCRNKITQYAFRYAKTALPRLSETEEQALSIGETWFEEGIFRGNINWDKLKTTHTALSEEEQAFIDNETQALCDLLHEWDIKQHNDLPTKAWNFIKSKGFLGLVIDKKYGGKGFSARAHSDIVLKIASHSTTGAVTVMVPNSLGPGELLQYYGTEEQKSTYLPLLAVGKHIPCFALTEPGAGSDATAIESDAMVFEKTTRGKTELFLSITLNKRWITLAPIATLIGVAVTLKDPQGLLKGKGKEGITCVLIERDTPHLEIGNRHLPADQVFMNGTIRGKDIIVPISSIIGGQDNAGEGWKMLVECLSIGRAISLPALSTASSGLSYITSSAYARVRRQFSQELIAFEGIQEKLAEIGGLHYLINATRLLTVAAVNLHLKPSVSSGITKYLNTELARTTLTNAMDIHAGRAVVAGPRNYLFNAYQSIPISITVEGANILSRNLLIFGQGSMACHPFLRDEFYAISRDDHARFNTLFWQHIRYTLSLLAKSICSAWTGGWLIVTPKHPLKRARQQLTRLSYSFAFLSDIALLSLGGQLKRKERLSARLADALCYLYASMAVIHYVNEQEQSADDLLHAKWATQFAHHQAQKAMIDFCHNFPIRPLRWLFQIVAFPMGRSMKAPNDDLENKLSKRMCANNSYRERLKKALFFSTKHQEATENMESTFQMLSQYGDLYHKIPELKRFKYGALKEKLAEKVKQGDLSPKDMDQLVMMERARWDSEQVDEFSPDAFTPHQPLNSITAQYKNPLDE
ncbi:MAG: acyl-CoA dehydrogenase [Gammaproteobacteria bacterium]|nr:acyl-CoA dehydrogenase [Gammaproteobacteria bacterium]